MNQQRWILKTSVTSVGVGLMLALLCGLMSGCAPGTLKDGSQISNTFYINATPDSTVLLRGLKADPGGQTVTPTATTTSQVSSDHGSVTVIIRQGTSEATTAAGLSASIPAAGM